MGKPLSYLEDTILKQACGLLVLVVFLAPLLLFFLSLRGRGCVIDVAIGVVHPIVCFHFDQLCLSLIVTVCYKNELLCEGSEPQVWACRYKLRVQ